MKLPKLVRFCLRLFFRDSERDAIAGDLEEELLERQQLGRNKITTDLYLLKTTLLFLRYPYTWKKPKRTLPMMNLKNSLKTAWRNLKKDRRSFVLNSTSLTVGLLIAMIVYLVLHRELTYDRWHSKTDRIYRVTYDETVTGRSERHLATVGPPMGPALAQDFDQVENYVRFRHGHTRVVSYDNSNYYEDRIFYIDSTLFSVFDYDLQLGNPKTAMQNPDAILLTQATAKKYFGDNNPLGKVLKIGEESFQVTGVFEEIPSNTHIQFDLVIPFHAFRVPFGYPVTLNDFGWISFHTYVLLREGVNPANLEEPLVGFIKTHWEEGRWDSFRFELQPLADIYLGDVQNEVVESGNWNNIYAFAITAFLLLTLIVFNYTNLAVAGSLSRSREVGVRKALGASKASIRGQFLLESMLLALIALAAAVVLLIPTLQLAESSLNATIAPSDLKALMSQLWFMLPATLIIGALAGWYPALIMLRTKTIKALNNQVTHAPGGLSLRKVLVTLQFMITIGLLVGSLVVLQQVNYLREKDLGFDKSALAVLRVPGQTLLEEFETLKQDLLANPRVLDVAIGGGRMDGDNGNVPVSTEDMDEPIPMSIDAVGYGFFSTLGIKLVAGRELSRSFATDSANAIIVNESAVKAMGYTSPEEALGRSIQVGDLRTGKIVGIASDFHHASLHEKIGPLAIMYPRTYLEDVYLRITPGNLLPLVQGLEATWKNRFASLPFDLIFLEDHLNQLYIKDQVFARLFQVLTALTILIACFGLYALISLITSHRTKEISVRKVLGASLNSLLLQLFEPFAWYILIAAVIVSPIAYFLLATWLDNYAYTIDLSLIWFVASALLILAVAFIATASHSHRISRINPARTLRSE